MKGKKWVLAVCLGGLAAVFLTGLFLAWPQASGEGVGVWGTLTGVLLAAGMHEVGHLAAAFWLGVPIRGARAGLLGVRIRLGGLLSYWQEGVIAASGPAVNLLTAAFLLPHTGWTGMTRGSLFCLVSVGLSAINLLPVREMDGGRVLRCILASFFGERVADGVLTVTTAIALALAWLALGYLLLRTGEEAGMFFFLSAIALRALWGRSSA